MKKTRIADTSKDQNYISTDILLNILFRLPIKAVTRCKCVCRAWYDLISEPKFSDDYKINSPSTPFLIPPRWGVSTWYDPLQTLVEISENGDCIKTPIMPRIPDVEKVSGCKFSDVKSCNGLLFFCFRKDKPFVEIEYVSNPITGEVITLPKREIDKKKSHMCDYKFGYCPSTNKFKVLRRNVCGSWTGEVKVEILTVGVDDKWRYLAEPFPWYNFPNDVYFNGSFHWNTRDKEIHTFDLVKEKFGRVIPYPSGLMSDWTKTSLVLLGDRICLFDCSSRSEMSVLGNHIGLYGRSSEISIWTMRENGVAESWTKDIVVSPNSFPCELTFRENQPFGILKNGDILFSNPVHKYLSSYNPGEEECKKVHIMDAWGNLNTAYTPRFSSLNQIIIGGQGNTNES